MAWLFVISEWLRQAWDFEWGERRAKSRNWAVAAASFGMFVALSGAVLYGFETRDFYASTEAFVEAMGLAGIVGVAVVVILVTTVIAMMSLIVGLGVYASSSERSYLSYAWRGLLVLPILCLVFALIRVLLFVMGATG